MKAIFTRDLPDGRRIEVWPLTFGRARIHLSSAESWPWLIDEW